MFILLPGWKKHISKDEWHGNGYVYVYVIGNTTASTQEYKTLFCVDGWSRQRIKAIPYFELI